MMAAIFEIVIEFNNYNFIDKQENLNHLISKTHFNGRSRDIP